MFLLGKFNGVQTARGWKCLVDNKDISANPRREIHLNSLDICGNPEAGRRSGWGVRGGVRPTPPNRPSSPVSGFL